MRALTRLGGIARTRELTAAGVTRARLAYAVATGRIQRIRIGWYGRLDLPDHVVRAHRVGGRPACASVAEAAGLWMLRAPGLHIEVGAHDSRFRSQEDPNMASPVRTRDDVVLHWPREPRGRGRLGQPLADALVEMAGCLDPLAAICAIDSALHQRKVTPEQLRVRARGAARALLERCDARAESGTETVFRLRARAAGFAFRIQVELPAARADFLFGDRLIVEVDGSEHHAGRDAFVRDRERDAWLAALGYRTVRFTYDQVVRRWHEVESVLRLLLARGEHRTP